VTSPIDLDDEGDLVAQEIHDVGTDRLLAAEFQSGETPLPPRRRFHSIRSGIVAFRRNRLAFLVYGGIGRP
jgi:hypothetical protein